MAVHFRELNYCFSLALGVYALFLRYIHILGAQQNCFSIFAGWPRGGQVLGKAIEFAFGVSYTLGALQSSGSERRTKIELY